MRWLMDVCPDSLGWEVWLILCAVIVVLWAAAIAGATALFQASGRPCRSERRKPPEERAPAASPEGTDPPEAHVPMARREVLVLDQARDVGRHAGGAYGGDFDH